MKTYRRLFSPRHSRLGRLFLIGFALSVAPLGAQTAGAGTSATGASTGGSAATGQSTSGGSVNASGTSGSGGTVPAQPSTSGATAPGSSPSSVPSPPRANTSFYNSPSTGTSTGAGGMYNPNGANPQAGTVKTGTLNPNVSAGGGAGSGQTGGTTSPSNP